MIQKFTCPSLAKIENWADIEPEHPYLSWHWVFCSRSIISKLLMFRKWEFATMRWATFCRFKTSKLASKLTLLNVTELRRLRGFLKNIRIVRSLFEMYPEKSVVVMSSKTILKDLPEISLEISKCIKAKIKRSIFNKLQGFSEQCSFKRRVSHF